MAEAHPSAKRGRGENHISRDGDRPRDIVQATRDGSRIAVACAPAAPRGRSRPVDVPNGGREHRPPHNAARLARDGPLGSGQRDGERLNSGRFDLPVGRACTRIFPSLPNGIAYIEWFAPRCCANAYRRSLLGSEK